MDCPKNVSKANFVSEQNVYHGFAALFEEQIHEFNKTE